MNLVDSVPLAALRDAIVRKYDFENQFSLKIGDRDAWSIESTQDRILEV